MADKSGIPSSMFSVITPSYNMLKFLPGCCNSVSDQNVSCEHIVVDGGSTDGTVAWLRNRPDLISISEKDEGMYDAINKGIREARGEIISYLNCDEQYLPGVLQRVKQILDRNPQTDILFGNAMIIRSTGELLAYRKSFVPRWPYFWASDMYVHSSSMFVRRRVFQSGMLFDKNWKMIGDLDFVIRVLRNGFRAQHVGEYFSVFMLTGSNLGGGREARAESKVYLDKAPLWLKYSKYLLRAMIRVEKALHGSYWQKMPLYYSVYVINDFQHRTDFAVRSASPFFPLKEYRR